MGDTTAFVRPDFTGLMALQHVRVELGPQKHLITQEWSYASTWYLAHLQYSLTR